MILRSLTTSALLSGGMGAETRGDIAAHGHGSERRTDGIDWSESSSLVHEFDEASNEARRTGRLGRDYMQGDLAAEGDLEGSTCISES